MRAGDAGEASVSDKKAVRMTRLIDDMRSLHRFTRPRVVQVSRRDAWVKYSESLWPSLKDPDLTVVTIDLVATFYFEKCSREFWDLGKTDHFPDLVPPRPVMWFEYHLPQRLRSEIGDQDLSREPFKNGRAGALVLRCRREEVEGQHIPAHARWIVVIDTFMDYGIQPGQIEGPHGCWALAIDEGGRIIGVPSCQSFTGNNRAAQEALQQSIALIHPPLLALSWLPREIPEDKLEIVL